MKIAAAPVSWGIFEVTLSAELPTAETYLDDVVELGYTGTESGPPGYLGDPAETRRRLQDRALELVGTFLPYDFANTGRRKENLADVRDALRFVQDLKPPGSNPVIILSDDYQREDRMAVAGRVGEHPELSLPSSGWAQFASNVNELAGVCVDEGFTVAFHPHVGSYVETPEEIDRLVAGLNASLIGLCMDIGHVAFGGGDPAELIEEYSTLIRHVHAKDIDEARLEEVLAGGGGLREAWQTGVFCDLGTGFARVEDCLDALGKAGYSGWVVVEQDRLPTGDDFLDSVRRSQLHNREFLARLAG